MQVSSQSVTNYVSYFGKTEEGASTLYPGEVNLSTYFTLIEIIQIYCLYTSTYIVYT